MGGAGGEGKRKGKENRESEPGRGGFEVVALHCTQCALLLFCFDEISGAPRRESDESEIPDTRLSPLVLYESNGGLELEHDHANQLRTTNGGGRGARSAQGARPP